jgi:endonuclease YncB( thermonuclease family)
MSTRALWTSAGGGTSLICLVVVAMWPDLACAEDRPTGAASVCRPAPSAIGNATSVLDGRTFVLDDGREVRLTGIEIPAAGASAAQAKERLHMLLAGEAVTLRGVDQDRYGRLVAQVFLAADPESWIQAELIASGQARVAAQSADRTCTAALLRREHAARNAKLGLWSDPDYAVRRAEDAAAVAAERGRFAIIEGRVLSVRESGGTVYINFGRRWSEDFTVTIAKRNERAFTAAGLEPKSLAGRRIRVRGWIEERGGPWIDAARPEQIELMERN